VVLEDAGLRVQLVDARSVKNVPGRAKTGKKDAAWLAKLTERGMLAPSFIPPHDIRYCGSTPGCAPSLSASGPGTGPGLRSCRSAP
jgi:hypothetical protein